MDVKETHWEDQKCPNCGGLMQVLVVYEKGVYQTTTDATHGLGDCIKTLKATMDEWAPIIARVKLQQGLNT